MIRKKNKKYDEKPVLCHSGNSRSILWAHFSVCLHPAALVKLAGLLMLAQECSAVP